MKDTESPTRVLIAEDDPSLQALIQIVLETHEFQVVGLAGNGEEAVSLHAQHRPDVTLMDIRMPKVDGLAALKGIRTQDPEALVIMLTAHGDLDTAVQSFRSQAFEFLTKPISPEVLLEVVRRARVHRRRQRVARDLCSQFASFDPELDVVLGVVSVDQKGKILEIDDGLLGGRSGRDVVGSYVPQVPELAYIELDLCRTAATGREAKRRWAVLGVGEKLRILRYSTEKAGEGPGTPAAFGVVLDQTSRKRNELRARADEREDAVRDLAAATQEQVANLHESLENSLLELDGNTRNLSQGNQVDLRAFAAFAQDRLGTAIQRSRQMQQMVSRFCEFARGASSSRTLFDINEVLKQVAAVASGDSRNLYHLVLDLAPGPIAFRGEPRELTSVFSILLDNARRAIEPPGELLVQSVLRDEMIQVVVADGGRGIAPEYEEKIFEPFYSTWGDGSKGLGLAVARKAVEDHGGLITVESEIGVGSLFTVMLPRPALTGKELGQWAPSRPST